MDPVYKKIEVVGTSTESIEKAIQQAVKKAGQSINHISWFEVAEIRGSIDDNEIKQYQVTVKLGFRVQE